MSSFVLIELDTRAPEVEIYAPSYSATNITNNIIVKSDENLSDFQEIYLIDSEGLRYDYTFKKDKNDTLIGSVNFPNDGIVTIYARVEDEVGNISELYSKSINIKESLSLLRLEIKDKGMNINTDNKVANTYIKEHVRDIKIKEVL